MAISDKHVPQLRLVKGLPTDRSKARQQVRTVLQAYLTQELACSNMDLQVTNRRNQAPQLLLRGQQLAVPQCSISHASGLALLAWHWSGSVGVDIQPVDTVTPRGELEAVAHLYLDKKQAKALIGIAEDALFFKAFTEAWTRQEACLKCAGLELVEWSEALGARLAGIRCAVVPLTNTHAAAVAWRP